MTFSKVGKAVSGFYRVMYRIIQSSEYRILQDGSRLIVSIPSSRKTPSSFNDTLKSLSSFAKQAKSVSGFSKGAKSVSTFTKQAKG